MTIPKVSELQMLRAKLGLLLLPKQLRHNVGEWLKLHSDLRDALLITGKAATVLFYLDSAETMRFIPVKSDYEVTTTPTGRTVLVNKETLILDDDDKEGKFDA